MLRKLALIIGNNDYLNNPLKTCVNDAIRLAETLTQVKDCKVDLQNNLKSKKMCSCIENFTKSITPNDFVIFFFAGHGIQWGNQNFLLPCDYNGSEDMQRYAINAQSIVDDMAKANPHIVVFLLDCCRYYLMPNNDRAQNQQVRGLHQMKVPRQTLIAFACAADEVVPDRNEVLQNGLFTTCLIKHITTPGVHIETILLRVSKDIETETNSEQRPFRATSIISEDVCLIPKGKLMRFDTEVNSNFLVFDYNSNSEKEISLLIFY